MKTNIKSLLMVLCGVFCIEGHAQSSHWLFDAYAYRYDMTVYVTLSIDGENVTDYSDYEIAAFYGEECRGIASFQKVERDGAEKTYGYLRIRSNQETGETITFKVYQKSTEKEMNIYNTWVEFHSQEVVGMPSTQMILPVVHFSVSISCDETKGTISGGGVYEAGATVTITATPKEGYHFVSWSDGEEANPYELTVTEYMSLSASFAPNQYFITYDLAEGTLAEGVTNPTSYTIESEDITLVNPTREGYTFEGWIGTDLIEPTHEVTIAKGSIGNRSYTAIWNVSTAITKLFSDGKKVNIYDLNGRVIRGNILVSMLNGELPNGIYIIDGRKVAITKQ